ncbi:uroporphyrinogen decarboxylase [Homoserinibacter sp. YIM 151385]|uniref:uroporphyrinogen decarboxylase n=1 Tax=Homoserinibacter sp. YIM 151385 TaxID=2985506 RepID=UPI0022F06752|nr:uroporphyrinogen decarboxylase [Homoserinibacter sp. YIM 151385]WBU37184.1 uroporphyrinogen decarboxylase [Homoserinibacter sp. YIM 151385]
MEPVSLPESHPLVDGRTAASPFVRAYRGERVPVRPVWFMRQAGRSLPEYRALREGRPMLESCLTPEIASEITLQPVRRHGVDAAVFFSDIVIPVKLAGIGVEIVAGRGPVLEHPIRTAADVLALRPLDPAALDPIREAVALTVAELGETPLIGFAGAPFTLASYLVEGGPSKDQGRARALMYSDPHAWASLLNWCADASGMFLRAQVEAGASAVQLFDSWVGSLGRRDYQRRVAPHSRRAFDHLRGLDVPKSHFGLGGGDFLDVMRDVGADVVGIDWRLPLDEANRRLGGTSTLQGNIDSALLGASWSTLRAHIDDVLDRGAEAPAHIVNLGHGVPPETDPEVLTRIVTYVHERG